MTTKRDLTKGERLENLMRNIDTEMQRLSWTTEQGREHLMKYYGKRSRLLLTEEELDNFLLYLQLTDTPVPSLIKDVQVPNNVSIATKQLITRKKKLTKFRPW